MYFKNNNQLLQERIYEVKLICGEDYPSNPPKIKFVNKVNMPGINQTTGWVDNNAFNHLKNWSKNYTIQDALNGIRKEMEGSNFKKLPQPQEGSVFPQRNLTKTLKN